VQADAECRFELDPPVLGKNSGHERKQGAGKELGNEVKSIRLKNKGSWVVPQKGKDEERGRTPPLQRPSKGALV